MRVPMKMTMALVRFLCGSTNEFIKHVNRRAECSDGNNEVIFSIELWPLGLSTAAANPNRCRRDARVSIESFDLNLYSFRLEAQDHNLFPFALISFKPKP